MSLISTLLAITITVVDMLGNWISLPKGETSELAGKNANLAFFVLFFFFHFRLHPIFLKLL